ncbi:hypothetical protein ZWY2020_044813 [Hordeum vulgare]|nr:hypothetical protein ZWY2020_044813 [Hordeum vulgare]
MVAKKPAAAATGSVGPEAEERKRLRSLAFSKGLLQRGEPAAPRATLPPSGAVARLQGRDIVRPRGQRRSRFLFSFPGLLAPAAGAGGRVGELADLGTKNPVLYLEFPQGRMKLLGTHVYPKNKYLTLQMTRSGKGVACEDVFESMIVFSEAWWVGTKEQNPDELKLEFPKELQNRMFSLKMKLQMCSTEEGEMGDRHRTASAKLEKLQAKRASVLIVQCSSKSSSAQDMIAHIIEMEADYINTSHPSFIGGSKAVEQAQQQVRAARLPATVVRRNLELEEELISDALQSVTYIRCRDSYQYIAKLSIIKYSLCHKISV